MFSKVEPKVASPSVSESPNVGDTPDEEITKSSTPPSIISRDMRIKGELYSDGDVQIDGQVEGDIRSKQVAVGKAAAINGAIMGDNLRIAGTVNGAITARMVTLTSTAQVTGDINHDILAVEGGAHVEGYFKRVEIDVQKLLSSGVKIDVHKKINAKKDKKS